MAVVLAIVFLSVWVFRMFRSSRRQAREADAANRGLLDEVADHRRTMEQLAEHASELERSLNAMRTEARIVFSLLNSIGDGVIVLDPDGKMLLFNPEAERLMGHWAAGASSGAWPAAYGLFQSDTTTPFPPDDLPYVRALAGEDAADVELFIRTPRAAEGHWVSAGANPLRDATGQVQGAVMVLRDVTAYKRAERMKDEFVSVVSHELRTPLTAIKGALGLLLGGAVGDLPAQARAMLDVANRNSDRLLLLINDILDIQKIESGRTAFKQEPVDLVQLVEQGLEANGAYARTFGVTLALDRRVEAVRVTGDPDRLAQVLANLLSNAVKFSPPNGRVGVAVTRDGGAIRVSVTDHGAGIPETFRPRLFQKFAQADASDTRQKGGTGLGLSICKAILDRLGGRIGYASELGRTTFWFEMPEAGPA
jgi:signal transduction histidine kinase